MAAYHSLLQRQQQRTFWWLMLTLTTSAAMMSRTMRVNMTQVTNSLDPGTQQLEPQQRQLGQCSLLGLQQKLLLLLMQACMPGLLLLLACLCKGMPA